MRKKISQMKSWKCYSDSGFDSGFDIEIEI